MGEWDLTKSLEKDTCETVEEHDACGKCYNKIQNFLEKLKKTNGNG